MMEEVQEQKFVCKFCNKCCFSGKSLGGHMRCHLALISAAKMEKVKADNKMGFVDGDDDDDQGNDYGFEENPKNSCRVSPKQSNSGLIQERVENIIMYLGSDDQDQESYGLRENPKKSLKASDLRSCRALRKGNLCKECGERFPSSRALSGHMRTHSIKCRDQHLCRKCGKGFDSMRAMFGHMKSHSKRSRVSSESADGLSEFDIVYPRKKRSVTRYKLSQNFSFSSANASSSIHELEEVEDAAMCLIMLSRGVRNWDGFNFPLEYPNNATSVHLDAKSFSLPKGMTKTAGDDFVRNPHEVDKTEKPIKELDFCFSRSADSLSKQNVSEFRDMCSEFSNGTEKKAELEVSVDESLCSGKSKMSRQVDVSGIEMDDSEFKRAPDSARVELLKDQSKVVGMDQKDLTSVDPIQCKKAEFNAHDPGSEDNSSDVEKCTAAVSEISKESAKKSEYKCRTCNMIFPSRQALGGHRNRHKILCNCSAPTRCTSHLPDDDTSTDAGSGAVAMADIELTKSRDHECPICFKVFATGQALGGHKRAHYTGLTESRIRETTVVKQELHDIQTIFDLNLPLITHQGPEMVMLASGCGGLEVIMSLSPW